MKKPVNYFEVEYHKLDGTIEIIRGFRDPKGSPLYNEQGNMLLWCPDRPGAYRQLIPSHISKIIKGE